MGRFATTASTYANRREPYPPAFFAAAADALKLTRGEALVDLGAGPGLLALGFAPYVGRLVAVDPEPAMVAEARRAAALAGVPLAIIEGRAEDLGADVGSFDLVTIGRALHWMDRPATLAALDRIVAPGGRILICGSTSGADNPWRETYQTVLRSWSESRGDNHRRIHEHWFDDTRFQRVGEIAVSHMQGITPEALFERALTRSTSSPAVLGPRVEAFRAELLRALAPFFPGDVGQEVIEAKARVFAAA